MFVALEHLFESALGRGGQDPRAVHHPSIEVRHLERAGGRCERDQRQEQSWRRPGHPSQKATSGGVSEPAVASKLGRTSAPSRYRAVKFVGNWRTSLLYAATFSM
jgi:hypothetical protein